ncbi:MAG: LTA synthase family protein, partial [Bacilli bacterium]|nr:LTA synthase family protein [Bacilli bacterium]
MKKFIDKLKKTDIFNQNDYKTFILTIILLLFLSCTIVFGTFCFSTSSINIKYIALSFLNPIILILNLFPIFLVLCTFYLLTNRLWLSYIITTVSFLIPSIINKFKLMYRDFPFVFEDVTLVSEAMNMTKTYEINIDLIMIVIFIIYILITIILRFIKTNKLKPRLKIFLLAIILFTSLLSYNNIYLNDELYDKLGDSLIVNQMSQIQSFSNKGFVYQFIYSGKKNIYPAPLDYNEQEVINYLNSFNYYNIDENKKVNIIAIMLESFNDFSSNGMIEFNQNIYENYHKIINESYHGSLITNVFGGGTIDTERTFLTGNLGLGNYLKQSNSFVWYLKEQGYYAEAMHPIYGWFYNRKIVNKNLGFDNFDYLENKYAANNDGYMKDDKFFQYIIKGYEENIVRNQPYFNFSVTYQNHGPYDENETGIEYVTRKSEYDEGTYNLINNYFAGIYNTNLALMNIVDYFRLVDDPVV